jgi:hypothetical protein
MQYTEEGKPDNSIRAAYNVSREELGHYIRGIKLGWEHAQYLYASMLCA